MDGEDEALEVIDLIYRLSRSLVNDIQGHVGAAAGLEMAEFALLRAVVGGTTSPSGLARDLRVHPAVISRTITRLVKAGLIERRLDPGDSRRVALALTDRGRATTDAIAARIRPSLRERLDALPDGDTGRLVAALRHLAAIGS